MKKGHLLQPAIQAIALGFLITLVSCASPATTDELSPVTAVAPAEKVELQLYGGGGGDGQFAAAMAPLIERFTQQNPDISVKVVNISNYPHLQIAQMITAGNPLDIMFADDIIITYLVERDLVLNMREFMAADMQFNASDIRENAMQGGSVFGKPDPYALPMALDTTVMLYNKAMFRNAGLPEPSVDWTWDDMIVMCKRIQETNPGVKCLGWANGWNVRYWYPWVRGHGGDVLNADHTQSLFSAPETVEGLQRFTELWTKHQLAQSVNEGAVDCVETQKCAMDITFLGALAQLKERYKFDYGLQVLPSGPKGHYTTLSTSLVAIIKGTKHPDQAWRFVRYLLSPEVQGGLAAQSTSAPVLKSARLSAPELQPLLGELDRAVRVPVFPDACGSYYFGDLQSLLQNAINNTIKGYVKLEDALKQADSRLKTCLLSGK